MSLPLEGIRVLDFSRLLPGPYCSLLLADMGAEVIRVEEPGQGDLTRWMPPLIEGLGATYVALNRGKKSLTLNLRHESAQAAIHKLIPHMDVVLEGFRPGVMARLGLDYERLSALHPGLVYCSISGYGQKGPLSQRAGHDVNYLALAGVLGATGPTEGPPQLSAAQVADLAGGAYPAAVAILGALLGRQRTGKGRYLDISMTEGALSLMLFQLAGQSAAGKVSRAGEAPLAGGLVRYRCYRTADGKAVALGALEPKFWQGFLERVGLSQLEGIDMAVLAGGGTEEVQSPEQRAALQTLEQLFLTRTRDEWAAFFADADLCLEPVLEGDEVFFHPLHRGRGMLRELALEGGGTFEVVSTPLPFGRESLLAGEDVELSRLPGAPRLGQDGEEVLRSAGFTEAELDVLRRQGGLL